MKPFDFQIAFTGLQVVQRREKQSPKAETRLPGSNTGRVQDRQASGPWLHPSCCGRPAGQRWYCNRTCRSGGCARPKVVPWDQNCGFAEGSSRLVHIVWPIPAARAGRPGREDENKVYLWISLDIIQISKLEIWIEILGYDMDISTGYHLDLIWISKEI
jgi:hypothetical protein